MNKRELRKLIRSMDKGREARASESAAICRRILASIVYRQADIIGGYMPLAHEADVTPVLAHALACGKTVALPLCQEAPHMTLRKVTSLSQLVTGAYGIPEPPEDAQVIPVESIQLLLVPLEGIDHAGYRLGKGGGYFDCLLANAGAISVGCALSWQILPHVPREPWDCPLTARADMNGISFY